MEQSEQQRPSTHSGRRGDQARSLQVLDRDFRRGNRGNAEPDDPKPVHDPFRLECKSGMYAGRHMGVIPRPCVTYDRAEMKAPQMDRFVNGLGVQGKLRFVDDRYARHQRQLKIVQYLKSRSCADLPMTLLAGNEFYSGAQGPATVRGERPEIVRVDRRSPLFSSMPYAAPRLSPASFRGWACSPCPARSCARRPRTEVAAARTTKIPFFIAYVGFRRTGLHSLLRHAPCRSQRRLRSLRPTALRV